MSYEGILEFKGTWRNYQARVLKNAQRYMADGKVHIVAAPGSGKTTLGIELIRRIGQPALVLAPSITIREQWVARIADAFLCEGLCAEDYLSQNLKRPKAITVATYQALHSAMTRFSGVMEEGEAEAGERSEEADFSDFDLVSTMREAGVGVLCLDECHHLRSEWWKALEEFKKQSGELKVISLTATPPYDSTPAMWKRYMDMCGEIDEEITIPELVKEGSLCAHQDFVYFNYPTDEERAEIDRFEEHSVAMMNRLMQDAEFAGYISPHKGVNGMINGDELLENPSALAALLIFLQEKKIPFPAKLQRLLGAQRLPRMSREWMEKLLQSFLYEEAIQYSCPKEYREKLIGELKAEGLIEKKKVNLTATDAMEKLLQQSKGKCDSIRRIVAEEHRGLGAELRLLVLTDYIRKEYEKVVGVPGEDISSLGVIPFFEMLRRDAKEQQSGLRLGVLCGTVVVIPAEAKMALEQAVEGIGKVTFSKFGSLPEEDYLRVNAVGDAHFLTGVVTDLFSKGYMQVLIGTKSLLGEGWDSPCVNSLILASFVGSFMLSNQMRGRAIRVWKEKPDKTSNIWHLVCLRPWNVAKQDEESISTDYTLLERRMEHFLGLNYTEDLIESGMRRLSIINPPFDKAHVEQMNQQTLELARQRDSLRERWQQALSGYRKMNVIEETTVSEKVVTEVVFKDAFRKAVCWGVAAVLLFTVAAFVFPKGFLGTVMRIVAVVALGGTVIKLPTLIKLANPYKRLKALGEGIRKALLDQNMFEEKRCKIVATQSASGWHAVALSSESGRDKALFAQCVKEFFAPVDNQRYLLVKEGKHNDVDGFYCVPECFGKKKEDAEQFAACLRPYIGKYELVYTRNEKGRELLLEGRIRALANQEERCFSHKKVKGALE